MLRKVITGGQTGVDQAAWRAALAAGLSTGGAMPRGFRTEDGPRPEFAARFGAVAIASEDVDDRTRANVAAADATLIFADDRSGPGTLLTVSEARSSGKPMLVVPPDPGDDPGMPGRIASWLLSQAVRVVNVGGDRESTRPGIGDRVERVLSAAFLLASGRAVEEPTLDRLAPERLRPGHDAPRSGEGRRLREGASD
ncbi:YpsA SLOG family protein [Tautonia sociabilis]|uniref:Molybdenum cofactor carrier n=1 Tax=Tautonia sociabilis TaxID=2080755 RepID=A0A432MG40_9BACT|nr:putative molybdenum carrier protein [Tautonia sociabilis]RUL85381.1 hypothetical protein TsocGM_18570 [Tautonia sociabilis]